MREFEQPVFVLILSSDVPLEHVLRVVTTIRGYCVTDIQHHKLASVAPILVMLPASLSFVQTPLIALLHNIPFIQIAIIQEYVGQFFPSILQYATRYCRTLAKYYHVNEYEHSSTFRLVTAHLATLQMTAH